MATRTIVVKIVLDNRDALNAAKAQAVAMRAVGDENQRTTQLQEGLTNSFIKGNLAARAISTAYLALRDATRFLASETVNFEFNMSKLSAILDASGPLLQSLEKNIRAVAISAHQGQNELALTALEMGKLGLSTSRIESSLEGVAKLSRALDENLVETGRTVVAVLNAYQFSASQTAKVTDELAFTVRASALDMDSFGTVFSYVGATARSVGVSFEDLAGAMDVLSNAGVRPSSIGTQLRRIFLSMADANSEVSKILGKSLKDYASFGDALDALAQKHLTAVDYSKLFGKTSASVADILVQSAASVREFSKETGDANGVVNTMADTMSHNLLTALGDAKRAFLDMGITESAQGLKDLTYIVQELTKAIQYFTKSSQNTNLVKSFTDQLSDSDADKLFAEYQANHPIQSKISPLGYLNSSIVEESAYFANYKAHLVDLQNEAKLRDNIVAELRQTLDLNKVIEANKTGDYRSAVNDPSTFNQLAGLYKGKAAVAEFEKDLKLAVQQAAGKELNAKGGEDAFTDFTASAAATKEFTREMKSLNAELKDFDERANDKRGIELIRALLQRGGTLGGTDLSLASFSNSALGGSRLANDDYSSLVDPVFGTDYKTDKKKQTPDEIKAAEKARQKLIKDLEEVAIQAQLTKVAFDDLGKGIGDLGNMFGQQLVASIGEGKNAFQNFDDFFGEFAKSIIGDLTAMIAKFLVFQAVALGLGVVTSGFGFASGSTLTNLILGGLGGKAFDSVKVHANGTNNEFVNRPTLFMAGEAGPERVTVTPRSKVNQGGGSGLTVIIQGHVYGADAFNAAVENAHKRMKKGYI